MKLKMIIKVIIPQLLTFVGIYFYSLNKSGGAIGVAAFTVLSFFFFLIIWGIISFKWDWEKKFVILISLIMCFLIEIGIMKFILF